MKKRNLILVSLDTVRADAVYDSGIEMFEGLKGMGTWFSQAFANAPLTPVSHATLFTGLLPYHHGLRHLNREQVSADCEPLAKLLRDRGYETAAFTSCAGMDRWYGFSNGFQHYDDEIPRLPDGRRAVETSSMEERGKTYRRGGETMDKALEWLAARRADTPFCCLVHLFDAHLPYEPLPPHDKRFHHPYLGECDYVAYQVSRLLVLLETRGIRENTVLVFFGDHGEDLGEHGKPHGAFAHEEGHGCLLFDVAVHVPLIFIGPGIRENNQIPEQASLVDVFPTVLEVLGVTPPYRLDGLSMAPALRGGDGDISPRIVHLETFFPEELEQPKGLPPLLGVRISNARAKHKVIWTAAGELWGVFDLNADPGEMHNLSHAGPSVKSLLRGVRSEFALAEVD